MAEAAAAAEASAAEDADETAAQAAAEESADADPQVEDAATVEVTTEDAEVTATDDAAAATDADETWTIPVVGPEEAITDGAALQDDDAYREQRRRRKALKTAGITLGAVVGAVVGVYLIGAAVFAILFFPQTSVVGVDLSLKNSDGAHQALENKLAEHDLTIVGQGIRLTMSSQEAGLGLNDEIISTKLRSTVNPWLWPYEVFQEHDLSDSFAVSVGSTNLADTLRAHADAVNATATQPINATVGYSADDDSFAIIPEQLGSAIDPDRLIEYVSTEITELPSKITLPDDVLKLPDIRSDNPQLQTTIEAANKYLGGTIAFTLDGQTIANLDKDTIGTFVVINPDLTVGLNDDAIAGWAAALADSYDTIGSERTYTRPDGKVVTVAGGDYGWSVSEDVLKDKAHESLNAGTPMTMDLPFNSTAAVRVPVGQSDWGARYIDVDLSEQHARLYDETGALIWESEVVSGKDTPKKRTPTGVFYIKSNAGSSVLRGFEDDGSQYESYVRYWMPFSENYAVGLHDADWRGSFGGDINVYNGSHGCVNLPVAKARELSSLIRVGDPVVVHY